MVTIKCDYDMPRLPGGLIARLGLVCRAHRLRVCSVRLDRTARGWHVVAVCYGVVSPTRLVLIQALLGSDWKRELFNSRRALVSRRVPRLWRDRWNVLYKRHYRGVTL